VLVCSFFIAFVVLDEPLNLSNYLNNPTLGHKLSEVHGLPGWNSVSYSGFFRVNNHTNSNMFFWYFPSQKSSTAPIMVWLQGGPGGSSMFGLFTENGPFCVSTDGSTLNPRESNWNQRYGMIYVDNPVGTGFSNTAHNAGFSTNENQVAANLYNLFTQFFTIFSELKTNDFYIAGESYAGKYVPSFAYYTHQRNKVQKLINLKGIIVGDGLMDPITQMTQYSHLAYWMGLVDQKQRTEMQVYENQIIEAIGSSDWERCFQVFDVLLNGDLCNCIPYFLNKTGLANYFNILNPVYPNNPYPQFLNRADIKKLIHVGNMNYADYNRSVEEHLVKDACQSIRDLLPTLLENYKVLFYNGNLDFIVGPAISQKLYDDLIWTGQQEFLSNKRIIWMGKDGRPAGYVRSAQKFKQVVILDAGHIVPADQPVNAKDMVQRFVENIPFTD